jgi:hypothetical protein
MTKDMMQAAGIVLGLVVGLPMLILIGRIGLFVGSIKTSTETTAKTLQEFVLEMREVVELIKDRQTNMEKQVAILWDGRERRSNPDRRENERTN